MAVRLYQVKQKYGDKISIKNVNIGAVPEALDDFPISAVPSIFFFNADGTAYRPTQDVGIQLTPYFNRDTNEHVLSGYLGTIDTAIVEKIFDDMLGN